jgi:flotillin
MELAQYIGIALGVGVAAVLLLIIFFKANIVLCQPNELVVISGRRRKSEDGSTIGYRTIRGGRGFKWPMVENVGRLSLNSLPVELSIPKAMTEGMVPINIDAKATVKLAGKQEEGMDAAIERFLGKGSDAVAKTASQALDGAIRGIVANMSPEEANSNRLELARQASEHARSDLRRLGIVLDFLQIQGVSDSQSYLEAIGRKKNAAVQRDAKIAEAKAEAEARAVSAEQKRLGREAEIKSETAIIEQENKLAVHQADLQADTNRAEQRAAVAGKIMKVSEEIELHAKRAELAEKQEQADTIVPAKARREALIMESEGKASRVREEGRAKAEAIELLRQQWEDGQAENLFLIQLMPELVDMVTRVVSENLRIDKLTILDGGNGDGLPTYVKNLTNSGVAIMEQLKNATGVDIANLVNNSKKKNQLLPKELDTNDDQA